MKRAAKLMLCLALMILLLTGCCFHKWEAADCTNAKTCRECGETQGEALGHDWADATCEEPKTCDRCGKTKGDANGHDWNQLECEACGKTRPEPEEAGAVCWDLKYFMTQYENMLMAHNQPMSIGELEQLSDEEYTFSVYYEDIHAAQITLTVDGETDYITHILAQEQPGPLPNANEHGMGHNSCVSVVYAAQMSGNYQLINDMHDTPVSREETENCHRWVLHVENMRIVQTHNTGEYGWMTTVEVSFLEDGE